MSKRLYTYAGFTATDLKNRASIPSQTDITVGSNYIDCSSVDIPSEIRDIIGEGSNDLGTIYMSAKVNKWSGFGPREWYVSGGLLLNRVKALPYDMANFCDTITMQSHLVGWEDLISQILNTFRPTIQKFCQAACKVVKLIFL